MITPNPVTYGWTSFDQQIVKSMSARPKSAIDTEVRGGMRCPLLGNDSWLSWAEGRLGAKRDVRNGTVWVGEPPVRFHAAPTYVLRRPIDNVIAGRTLIAEALSRAWGRAETSNLAHENSQDALTWNVFRSLQENGALPEGVHALSGIRAAMEPVLYLWGRRIDLHCTSAWPALASAHQQVEPWDRRPAGPACCLHVPGQAWIFINTTFGSPVATTASVTARNAWLERYGRTCPGVFRTNSILSTPPTQFPDQLLRHVAIALRIRKAAEEVIVIALVRQNEASSIDVLAHRYLNDGLAAKVRMATWEQIHRVLPQRPSLDPVRRYLECKSYRLQPAFSISSQAAPPGCHGLAASVPSPDQS